MSVVLHGVLRGKTIELREPANLPEGDAVRVMLLDETPASAVDDLFPAPLAFERSRAAFLRDLPNLLRSKKLTGRWVLYYGSQRVKFAASQKQLISSPGRAPRLPTTFGWAK